MRGPTYMQLLWYGAEHIFALYILCFIIIFYFLLYVYLIHVYGLFNSILFELSFLHFISYETYSHNKIISKAFINTTAVYVTKIKLQ